MKKWAVLVCCLALSAGVAQAQATGEYSEIEKLIRSFRDAEVSGELVTATDPEVVSPFGGPSQLPPETTDPITVSGTFAGIFDSINQPVAALPDFPVDRAVRPAFDSEFTSPYPLPEDIGQFPALSFDRELARQLLDEAGWVDEETVIAGEGDPFALDIVIIDGGLTIGPIPLDCPGQIMEFGRVDAISGQPIWEGFTENDLFNGGSQAIVTRCIDGTWEVERLVNLGEQFVPMPTNAISLVFPEGWLTFIPHDELLGSTGHRNFGFVTPTSNPFQPDTTGSTAVPFPGLAEPGYVLLLPDPNSYLPGPPSFSEPTTFGFSNGSCSPEIWEDYYDVSLVEDMVFFQQLSTGQLASGDASDGAAGLDLQLLGSGPGFTEEYSWSQGSGSYLFTNGGSCTWDLSIEDPLVEGLETALTAQVTTTTQAETTTTAGATTTTAAADQPEDEPGATADTPIWPWALIGLGLVALGLGGFFLLGGKDPCEELRKAWEAAERRRQTAEDGLKEARDYLRERQARVTETEGELAALERAAQSSVTEDGVTYHAITEGRVTSEGLRSLTETARHNLADARAAEAGAVRSVTEWEGRLADATKVAEEARATFERCVGEHTPKPAPAAEEPATVGDGATVATGFPVVATHECTPGDREVRSAGKADTINVTVDFSIFVEVVEGSGRQVEAGKTLALDLSDLAGQLGTMGSLLGAYGSGRSVGQGALGLQAGTYTLGGGRLVRGGVEGYIAGADPNIGTESFPISIPTSPQDAITEVLEATARLGALVAGKVSEWMEMNQLYRVRMTYFYQTITAAPHQVWVCLGGRWVCEELIYEVTIGSLQTRPGPSRGDFRLESDIARSRFEAEIQRMVARGRSELEQSAGRKAEFEQAHQPGPCQ